MANKELKLGCGTPLSEIKTNQRIWGLGGTWFDGYPASNAIAEVVGRDYLVLRNIDSDHAFFMDASDVRVYCYAIEEKSSNG